MEGKVEVNATPAPTQRQQSMEAFCTRLLEEVKAGKVRQLLAIVEAAEPIRTRAPLLYLNCDEDPRGAMEFMEDVCACVSHAVDRTCIPAAAPTYQQESTSLH